MKKSNIVYKVVGYGQDNEMIGTLASSFCVPKNNLIRLEYGINKTTIPKCGKIFVFNSLEAAKEYIDVKSNRDIIKGIATGLEKCKLPTLLNLHGQETSLRRYWESYDSVSEDCKSWPVPKDTYLCSSFKGLEVVK